MDPVNYHNIGTYQLTIDISHANCCLLKIPRKCGYEGAVAWDVHLVT
jgi:hypothetical protein